MMPKHCFSQQKDASSKCLTAPKLTGCYGVNKLAYQPCTDRYVTQQAFTGDQYLVLMEAGILIFDFGQNLSNFLSKNGFFYEKLINF